MRVAMVACGLVACVGGGGGGDGLRLDQFAGRLAEAQCAQMQRCCESEWPDCVAFFTMALEEEADIVDMRASIAAGRLTFDGDQAARCIERVEGLSCAEFSAFLQNEQAATGLACFDMLVGRVAAGDPCDEPYECVTGVCGYETAIRRCEAPIPAGGSCNSSCADRPAPASLHRPMISERALRGRRTTRASRAAATTADLGPGRGRHFMTSTIAAGLVR